jgi:hypothetical protein
MARTSASARPLTDHEEIRRWAEERGAKPTCVRGTGNNQDVGMIRLDFPGYSGQGKLEEISWDEWLDKFDESGLALLVQDETARGQRSNFNKLVRRDTAETSEHGRSSRSESSSRSQSRGDRGRQGREGQGYKTSAGDSADADEDFEEEIDIEVERPIRARVSNSGNRKRQVRAKGTRSARSRRSSQGSRSRRTATASRSRNSRQSAKSRSSRSRRGQVTGGSRSSGKKAPARAKTASRSSRSSSRAANSRRRAA